MSLVTGKEEEVEEGEERTTASWGGGLVIDGNAVEIVAEEAEGEGIVGAIVIADVTDAAEDADAVARRPSRRSERSSFSCRTMDVQMRSSNMVWQLIQTD